MFAQHAHRRTGALIMRNFPTGRYESHRLWGSRNVLAMWDVTCMFRVATTWKLNADKSVRFATSPETGRLLRESGGPPVHEGFLDLGVQQVVTNRNQPALADKRFSGGFGRFSRCGRLPVSLQWRTRITAASGVGASVYGAGQH